MIRTAITRLVAIATAALASLAFYALMCGISILASRPAKSESPSHGGDQAWIVKALGREYPAYDRRHGDRGRYVPRYVPLYVPVHYHPRKPEKRPPYRYDWTRRADRDWERDDDWRHDRGRHCRNVERAVGKEDNNLDHAKADATRQWMESVRFKWGVRFMDPSHAKGARYVCARSGTGGRAGEKVLKAVPFAKKWVGGEFLTQCEVRAAPCEAPEVSVEDGDEDKDKDKD